MVLHDLLLRLPPRGGRRGHAQVAHRFHAWAARDLATVVKWWEQDRTATKRPIGNRPSQEKTLQRAMHLIREGELGKATRLLHNTGLGDLTDPRIIVQLRAKHPCRKADLPPDLANMGQFIRIQVDLEPTLRDLPRLAGTGVSGFRHEYLTALTEEFADGRARSAIQLLSTFATLYANADLPPWFYFLFSSIYMSAPIKTPPCSWIRLGAQSNSTFAALPRSGRSTD